MNPLVVVSSVIFIAARLLAQQNKKQQLLPERFDQLAIGGNFDATS